MKYCWQDLRALVGSKHLLWTMTQRELASRYAGSAGGIFWAYLQPVLIVGAYFLVFDVVFGLRMGNAGSTRVGTYLVAGALPWLAFCESLARGASSLVDAGGLLQKSALPPVLFVARSVFASWVVYVPLILALTLFYLPMSGVHSAILAIPLLLILQGVLALSLAYIFAVLTAATRDTTQVLSFSLSVGIYLSPILFPLNLFPSEWQWVLFANPMTALVMSYQAVLLHGTWPAPSLWVVTLCWLLALALSLNVLIGRSRDELVDWL